jgi:hypothetical protein
MRENRASLGLALQALYADGCIRTSGSAMSQSVELEVFTDYV